MNVKVSQFLPLLDELLELEPGTVEGDSRLEDVGWNSLAVVGFIALVDENFGIAMSPPAIAKCETARDLTSLLGEHLVG
jgi:acyl carrier protein